MLRVNSVPLSSIKSAAGFDASACMNCGGCTALCHTGIKILPRRLFRYVLLDAEDKVMENIDAIYSCLLCRMCEENCPAGVHIAENVRLLRAFVNRNVYGLSGR